MDGGSFDGISNVESFPSWLKVSLDILDGDVVTLNKIIAIILYTQQIILAEPSLAPFEETMDIHGSETSSSSFYFTSCTKLLESLFIAFKFAYDLYDQIRNDSDGF